MQAQRCALSALHRLTRNGPGLTDFPVLPYFCPQTLPRTGAHAEAPIAHPLAQPARALHASSAAGCSQISAPATRGCPSPTKPRRAPAKTPRSPKHLAPYWHALQQSGVAWRRQKLPAPVLRALTMTSRFRSVFLRAFFFFFWAAAAATAAVATAAVSHSWFFATRFFAALLPPLFPN